MAKLGDFEQLGCQVVVVDSGTRESGLEWLQKHSYPFPLLLDRDRVFYRQVGLRRFLKNVVSIITTHLYADHRIAGANEFGLPSAGSDMSSIGGDFIIDSTGKLLFSYFWKHQFDRPAVEALVEFLQKQDKN